MATCNNTYIGARYVPVYADPVEWTPDREYEHLTIVTYEGNSYTSRCAVPIGITLDNKEYWVQSFLAPPEIVAINAKIKTIQQELARQADNIASIEEEIKNLQGGSSALENRVEALETSQAAQDTEIANIKTEQTTQNTDINTLKTDVTGLDTRVTNLETSQADQDLKIASLENKDTEQDDKLTALETSQAAQDTEIATIKELQAAQANDMADLNTRLTAAELQVETNKTDISALNTKTDKTNTDLSNLTATVQAHTQSITNLNGEIINHDAEINNLKDVNAQLAERLDNQETELNTTNANVSNLSTTVANQTTAINSIQTQLNDQHDDINELQNGQATLTNQYNTLTQSLTETNNTVAGIQTDIDEINEKIKDVPSDITSLTSQVNKNTSDIESNDADILALQTSQQQQDTKITDLETEVGNHDMMLETLEDDMNALETHVSGLTSKVDTNTTDIQSMQAKILSMTQYWVNVKDYGAKGDGTTDDTQAFISAVSYLESLDTQIFRTLIIPDGKYNVQTHLYLHGRINVVGVGNVTLYRNSGDTTYPYIMDFGNTTSTSTIYVSNIDFINEMNNGGGINFVNVDRAYIDNCYFRTSQTGIFSRGENTDTYNVTIHNCQFISQSDSSILLLGSDGHSKGYFIIDSCVCLGFVSNFLRINSNMNVLSVINCHILTNNCGIIQENNKANACRNWFIENNYFVSANYSIKIDATSYYEAEINIKGNQFDGRPNATEQLSFSYVGMIDISNNEFINSKQYIKAVRLEESTICNNKMKSITSANSGIVLERGYDIVICGNYISMGSQVSYSAIELISGSDYIITGNRIKTNAAPSGSVKVTNTTNVIMQSNNPNEIIGV